MLVDAYGRPLLPAGAVRRADSWQNPYTGVGTANDKTTASRFLGIRRVTDTELTNLVNGSALAAKVVEKRAKEMFRRGYELECADVEASACNDLQEHAVEELGLDVELLEAKKRANQYGGYLLLLGADDGGAPDEPLDESRIRTFTWLEGVDRRYAYVNDYYGEGPKRGKPMTYLVSNAVTSSTRSTQLKTATMSRSKLEARGYQTAIWHESRVLRFDGVQTDVQTRQQLAGWSWSVLQRVYDGLRKFEQSFDSAAYLLSDASQAVFTLKGLISAITSGKQAEVYKRLELIETYRSVMHAICIDDGEKFERTPTPFGGIGDVLDKMMLRFAADADMPVTELFGRAASGLNAAAGADSETRKWYDGIESDQKTELAPQMRRAYRLLSLSGDCPVKLPAGTGGKPLKWKIKYHALLAPSSDEQAKTDLAVAQRDQIYLGEGVISPEECALDRQDLYPSMDVDAREAAVEGATAFDPHENDPEVPVPGAVDPATGVPVPPAPGVPAPAAKPPPAAPAVKPKTPAPAKKPVPPKEKK